MEKVSMVRRGLRPAVSFSVATPTIVGRVRVARRPRSRLAEHLLSDDDVHAPNAVGDLGHAAILQSATASSSLNRQFSIRVPLTPEPVSYTHLTLPTIYSV